MGRWQGDSDYQIGSTAATMMTLRSMGVPIPDQVLWKPGAVNYVKANFARVWDGYASIDWIWDGITIAAVSKLLSFLNGAESARVYVVSDKRDGVQPNPKPNFALFDVTMWKPMLSGQEGVSVVRSPYVLQTVKIQFVNAIEQWATYPMYGR